MTSPPLESSVEDRLVKAVKSAGGLCFKLPAFLYRGIPDRLILLNGGVVWFMELKRSGASTKKSVRIHQERFGKKLLKMGFNWCRIKGSNELEEWIHDHLL